MNLMWLLAYLLVWTKPGEGILHTKSMTTFSATFSNDSYFGYSLTYESFSKQLIVSAPQEGRDGTIFSCELNTTRCTTLNFRLGPSRAKIEPNNRWLGATVKAGPAYFVTCAPLFIDVIPNLEISGFRKRGAFSRCLKYDMKTHNIPSRYKEISIDDRQNHATLSEHGMDSFGWSIDVDKEDVIIGGPAMFTGRVAKYTESTWVKPISLTGFMNPNRLNDMNRRVDYNFGYSVVVGHFSTTLNKKVKTYAIGSPYGKGGRGTVSFFTFSKSAAISNGPPGINKNDLITDDENAIGSMFGAVLCAAKLKGDKDSVCTSLLVGAPTYASSPQYDRGAVYFYAPAPTLPLSTPFRKIVGFKDGGRYGSAIARLGDYNGDGLDEIAIAAPYENIDTGVVYIYSSKDIISDKGEISPMQKISPKERQIGFGTSLTAIQDYDDNGCNELAIGAPQSNKVTYVKCIASVTAVLRATIPQDLSLRDNNEVRTKTEFKFESCLNVTYPKKPDVVDANIRITVKVDPSTKLKEKSDESYDVKLVKTQTVYCKNITVLAPENGQYQYPIKYNLSATQIDPPANKEKFLASEVTLNDLSVLSVAGNIWLTDCKNVSSCRPKLILAKRLSVTPEAPYVLGSLDVVKLQWSVVNKGETAYASCVRVSYPKDISVAGGVPAECSRLEGLGVLKCVPPEPLCTDVNWKIPDIKFDLGRLTSEYKSTSITVVVDQDCTNEELKGGEIIPIPLKHDYSNIFVKGITDTGVSSTVNMSISDVEGKTFEHSYTITSGALTNWVNVRAEVVVQNRSFVEYSPFNIEPNGQCPIKSSNDTTFIVICEIVELNTKNPIKITLPMKILNLELLDGAMRTEQNTQFTSLTLKLNEMTIQASETTTIGLGDKVENLVTVVASLNGLLILLLIFFPLTKCGFFKRKNKQRLENVRRSVSRQTMMRKTMTENERLPPGGDQQSLLASVPQETADEAAARDHRLCLEEEVVSTTRPIPLP